MGQNNVSIAEAYYKAVGEKNIAALEKYLHLKNWIGSTSREVYHTLRRTLALLGRD